MEVNDQAMAADKQVSAASRRRTRLSGWVLSQFQVTLAICGIVVGFLVCFGLGFLSGVWFQTQEQMLSHDDAITLADDQLDRERKTAEREMTFYSSLTSRDGTVAPELRPRAITASVPPAQHPSRSTTAPAGSSTAGPASSSTPPQAKPEATEPERALARRSAPLRAATASRSVVSESPGETSATPQSKREATVASANAPEERFYSVQVGSFRRVEQAYRLQDQLIKKGYQARIGLSIVEGKGAWYRVRVGRYADRGSANKTAQRLQKKENIDVLVMRVSS